MAAARPRRSELKSKLPTMNGKDRSKFYRLRMREYEASLEAGTSELVHHVGALQLVHQIQQQLVELATERARQRVLVHVWAFMDAKQYLTQHALLSEPTLTISSVGVSGDDDGLVVRIDAELRGRYAPETIEKHLYPAIAGNSRLLDKLLRSEIVYTSAFRFYFDSGGELLRHTAEIDFAAGLLQATACSLEELNQLLQVCSTVATHYQEPMRDVLPAHVLDFLAQKERETRSD